MRNVENQMILVNTEQNCDITPSSLCYKVLGKRTLSDQFSQREMKKISVSLQFSREICPFPVNLYTKTTGKNLIFLVVEKDKSRLYPYLLTNIGHFRNK